MNKLTREDISKLHLSGRGRLENPEMTRLGEMTSSLEIGEAIQLEHNEWVVPNMPAAHPINYWHRRHKTGMKFSFHSMPKHKGFIILRTT